MTIEFTETQQVDGLFSERGLLKILSPSTNKERIREEISTNTNYVNLPQISVFKIDEIFVLSVRFVLFSCKVGEILSL